jgi:hypothetical protein
MFRGILSNIHLKGGALSYFQEAKAHFVASHQNPINQALHHLTNMLAIAAVVLLWSALF